jgi:hypothetical protein
MEARLKADVLREAARYDQHILVTEEDDDMNVSFAGIKGLSVCIWGIELGYAGMSCWTKEDDDMNVSVFVIGACPPAWLSCAGH